MQRLQLHIGGRVLFSLASTLIVERRRDPPLYSGDGPNANFKVIIAEGRKFSGKILVATQKWRPLKELVPVYLPGNQPQSIRSNPSGRLKG